MKKRVKGTVNLPLILIISISILVISGMAYFFFSNSFENVIPSEKSEDIEETSINLKINNVYEENGNLVVDVKRDSGEGELTGVRFILSAESYTETISLYSNMVELEAKNFVLTPTQLTLSEIKNVFIIPIYKSLTTKEAIGKITDQHSFISDENTNINELGTAPEGVCTPNCIGLQCGFDSVCGQLCGGCDGTDICTDGICVSKTCIPNSNITTCGSAKCGTKINNCGQQVNCGTCNSGTCTNGVCIIKQACTPTINPCDSKQCGTVNNGTCGTVSCGTCASEKMCQQGTCVQIQSCQTQSGVICKDYQTCDGSVLLSSDSNRCCSGICKLPSSFDWRSVHGENWTTPLRQNSVAIGACSEFAFTGSFESQINIFYNQHLDVDLSEQMKIDCNHGSGPLNLISNDTLVDEACSPFSNRDIYCNAQYQSTQEDKCCNIPYLCNNWLGRTWKSLGLDECTIPPFSTQSRQCLDFWYFDSEEKVKIAEDKIKEMIVSNGPMKVHISGMGHSMILIGYKREKSDWKTIEKCASGSFCVANRGCILNQCNPGDQEFNAINYDPTSGSTVRFIYTCKEYGNSGIYLWTSSWEPLTTGEISSLPTQQRSCDLMGYAWDKPSSYVEYRPSNGDTIWIFRDWYMFKEQALDARQFGILTIPSGPFVSPSDYSYWPTGFTNQISCVDKDNDEFCNWGISKNKPSTCLSSCNLEKDWDDSNFSIGALGFY